MFELNVCEILAFLVADLLEKQPDDPLMHMLDALTFPFASSSSAVFQDPHRCEHCAPKPSYLSAFGQQDLSPCCVYSLREPFANRGDVLMKRIAAFLNSKETIMIIVGDGESQQQNGACDCFGSGKSRLCRWLDFPGRYVHKRKVLRVDSGNIGCLIEFLESVEGKGSVANKLTELSDQVNVSTLSLIDSIEPPHHVLHALIQHNYFRAERRVKCCSCNNVSLTVMHKTIIFSRPGVFFKFPLPCSVFSLVRASRSAFTDERPRVPTTNVSFTALVGPAHGPKKKRVTIEMQESIRDSFVQPSQQANFFKEAPSLQSPARIDKIISEITSHFLKRSHDPMRPSSTTLDMSRTFSSSVQSRSRAELLIARRVIEGNVEPPLDFSEFPELVQFLVQSPQADFYFGNCLERIFQDLRSNKPINKLRAGNLLCLAVASQQTLSPYSLSATASEMLQLYLDIGADIEEDAATEDSALSFSTHLPDALECVNLQNVIIENVESSSQTQVAQNLLDVRGCEIKYELLDFLVRGTLGRRRHGSPVVETPVDHERLSRGHSEIIEPLHRGYGHPVLLLSDVTDVGRHGYEGHATLPSRSLVVGLNVLYCFIVDHVDEGVPLVVTVEKNRVVARTTFAKADTEDENDEHIFWQVVFLTTRSVVSAMLLRESFALDQSDSRPEERLALLLVDGSVCCINLTEIQNRMIVTVGSANDGEDDLIQAKFAAPPERPPPTNRSRHFSFEGQTQSFSSSPGTRRKSFVRRDSRVTLDVSSCSSESSLDPKDDFVELCDKVIAFVDHKTLECEDPNTLGFSRSWIAAANHDSDIACVARMPLGGAGSPSPTFLQTECNISCLCIVNDKLLVAGLEDGNVQAFSIETGEEVFLLEHHEARVNVIRSMTRCESSCSFLIVGSDDSTMTIFCEDDLDPIRSIRFHAAPVVDVVATHAFSNGVLISADRNGTVIVSSVDPIGLSRPGMMLWSANFLGLRSLSLSRDASWLVCSRHQNSPVALPIAEWTRQGTGQFHQKPVSAIHITNDEKFLLTGGDDGLIFVWDLEDSVKYVSSFQQHSSNSSISSISTSTDTSKVVSADATNLVCLWKLSSGTLVRILARSNGGGFARFIANDFLLVRTNRGLKIFDHEEKLFAASSQQENGCLDVFFAPDDLYQSCMNEAAQVGSSPKRVRPKVDSSDSSDSNEDEECDQESRHDSLKDAQDLRTDENLSELHQRMGRQCFLGIARGNSDSGVHYVSIFALKDLEANLPRFELIRGEAEDEFGDEEELSHSDRITAFTFLQPRPQYVPISDPDSVPPAPTIFLAATGAEDLTVILWNWKRQQPLKLLNHTDFVTSCHFWFPSLGSRVSYTTEQIKTLSTLDPSFDQCRDGAVVCNLITSQYADSVKRTTLRVYQIRESIRAFQKRILGIRCGQVINANTFPYSSLTVSEVSTNKISLQRDESSSVRCVAIRHKDGLICTGDQTCQVIFWRLMSSRGVPLMQYAHNKPLVATNDEDSDSDDKTTIGSAATVQLQPLRRIVSRI